MNESLTAPRLYGRLGVDPPPILDVRNADEFGRWHIDGPRPLDLLNVPYFEFIEREEASVRRVSDWLAGRPGEFVVVCAKGDSSAFVADLLRSRGLAAMNLEGGMVAWGLATVFRPLSPAGAVRVWQGLRFGRGCLSYVVSVDGDAVVVDPPRGIDDFQRFLDAERLRLRGVLETHLHADHVSGAPALARAAGVGCHVNAADFRGAAFSFEPVTDGVRLRLGGVEMLPVVPMHTPGHTPGSTTFLVNDRWLLTGDTVFVDGLGRPDLGGRTAEWARDLFRTLDRRLARLPADLTVLPAHSGGPQEVGPTGVVAARLGDAIAANVVLTRGEESFVREAEASAGMAPPQYGAIREINLHHPPVAEEELIELELGRNQCAMSRR
ncbi:MAG TPA: MBL fold metallo-hydrolase [Methylomirabilota bacterium]|nr:MBL fold metallo-hydrolase [Methylomirabilota bacterium]